MIGGLLLAQVQNFRDYRHYLKAILEERSKLKVGYSLRAFAGDLGMHPPRLSEILNEKKGLSLKAAGSVSSKLALSHDETEYFCDLVQHAHAKSPEQKRVASVRLSKNRASDPYKLLKDDAYRSISEWYHYAILELTFTEEFQNDSNWIASRLKISPVQAKLALERLKRLKLLREVDGKLKKVDAHVTTSMDIPSTAIRKTTSELLKKAASALEIQKIEDRDFSTLTMAIDKSKIPAAKEMIADFRRRLCDFLESGQQQDVYCLSIQLFQLSTAK